MYLRQPDGLASKVTWYGGNDAAFAQDRSRGITPVGWQPVR
jgi:hypothetical protein